MCCKLEITGTSRSWKCITCLFRKWYFTRSKSKEKSKILIREKKGLHFLFLFSVILICDTRNYQSVKTYKKHSSARNVACGTYYWCNPFNRIRPRPFGARSLASPLYIYDCKICKERLVHTQLKYYNKYALEITYNWLSFIPRKFQ